MRVQADQKGRQVQGTTDSGGGGSTSSAGGSSGSSSSSQEVKIDNNGNAKDTPYGDSKLPNSYIGADYYDCYVPYNLTPNDIGGWANAVLGYKKESVNYSMETYPERKGIKFATQCMLYMSVGGSYKGCPVSTDDTGAQIVTDANGAKYYLTAIQAFFYNFPGIAQAGSQFPGFSSANRGQIIDVILTNGTCIHFVVCDANAIPHTNGGPTENPLTEVQWGFAPMKLNQYKNIYQAANANMLELAYVGGYDVRTKFESKFNMGSGDDKAKIAFYRMYNKSITAPPARAANVGNEAYYVIGKGVISDTGGGATGATIGGQENNEGNQGGSKIVAEWELAGMPTKSQILLQQAEVSLPTRNSLSIKETNSIAKIKDSIAISTEATMFDRARVLVIFIGLLLTIYSMFMFMAVLFDRVNNFVDISLVKIITFGRVTYTPGEESLGRVGVSGTTKLCISSAIVFVVGLLLISGCVMPALGNLIYNISSRFM